MEGIIYRESFLDNHRLLFEAIKNDTVWNERMTNRKTASLGVPYNYSQMKYPFQEFTQEMVKIIDSIEEFLGFRANNCLINYYVNGNSRMGFHSDQTNILEENTGVVIISLGETRVLQFRNIIDRSITENFNLISGSLLYMDNNVQRFWQHAIPKSSINKGRISLTFRKLK